jgi:hypothetical protein
MLNIKNSKKKNIILQEDTVRGLRSPALVYREVY